MYSRAALEQEIRNRVTILFNNDFKAFMDNNLDTVIDKILKDILLENLTEVVKNVLLENTQFQKLLSNVSKIDA